MKKYIYSLLSMMAIICLFMTNTIMIKAEDEKTLKQENYDVSAGELIIFADKAGDYDLSRDNLEVKLEQFILPIESIEYFNTSADPITYYCLVDVSGSLDYARMETIKSIMLEFVSNMKAEDNMVVATIADEHVVSDYLSDKDELTSIISQIAVKRQNTNLYYSVSEAIKSLEQNPNVHKKRCLLIFSDGAEVQSTGITKDEVTSRIEASGIPVFTVAMIHPGKTYAQIESAKILGSFARISVGGVHYAPLLEGYDYSAVSGMIIDELNKSYKVTCEIKDIELTGSSCTLQTTWKIADGSEFMYQKEIPTDRIKDYIEYTPPVVEEVVEETVVEETVVEETTVEPEEPETGGISSFVIIGIVGIVLAIIIIIVIILINQKKKKEEEARIQQEMLAKAESERIRAEKERQLALERAKASSTPQPAPKMPDITIKLVNMGTKEDEVIQLPVYGECKVGRSAEKCDFVISDDKAVSSLHCTITYRNKRLYIRDNKSSNGTFVNGIPLADEYELQKDDVVYIGSKKYRVVW